VVKTSKSLRVRASSSAYLTRSSQIPNSGKWTFECHVKNSPLPVAHLDESTAIRFDDKNWSTDEWITIQMKPASKENTKIFYHHNKEVDGVEYVCCSVYDGYGNLIEEQIVPMKNCRG
jgi:hypothetical protein